MYLDETYALDGTLESDLEDSVYTMVIGNGSMELVLPTGKGAPDWLARQ